MTDTTDQQAVTVAQEDREAAAKLFGFPAWENIMYVEDRATSERVRAAVLAFARHRLASVSSASAEAVTEAAKPWANYHGDLPDYDHPLRPVFESGIQYTVEMLAKQLDVAEWVPCDGTEEFDGDLGGTLMNIVLEAMPKDEHGDAIWPRDLPGNAASSEPVPATNQAGEVERAVLTRIMVAHNRLNRSETTAQEFEDYTLPLLAALATQPATSQEGERVRLLVAQVEAGQFDELAAVADRWAEAAGVQRMMNAIASVFEKYAPQEIMDRFREKLAGLMHLAFVEGAAQGVLQIAATPTPPTLSEDLTVLTCDCDCATVCPNGKTGSEAVCQILVRQ